MKNDQEAERSIGKEMVKKLNKNKEKLLNETPIQSHRNRLRNQRT